MLNKNINKVRRIAKARFGLSIPSGNPYMTTNGLAIPGNSITQQNLLGRDYGAEFRNRAEQIMAPTNDLIDFNAKMGDLFSLKLQNDRNTSRAIAQMNTNGITTPKSTSPSLQQSFQRLGGWSTVGQVADFAGNIIGRDKDGYFGKYGALQQTGDQLFDQASNVVMTVNPLVGGIMKAGGLASDILTKYAGMGTDSMTKTDAVLGSKLLSLTPAGMINGFFGKRTRDFSANKATIEQVGGSYGGTVRNINEASEKAGKKYGLFSSGKRKQANRFIDRTESQQSTMTNIAKDASDLSSIAANMSDLNHMQYGFNLNGGYDQRYMRAAKFGAKLKRVKRINFRKQGGEIVGAINLDNWQPVITEAVEQFENGGELEWTPVITLQDGGQVEKWDFETWFNSIPSEYRAPQYDYQMAFNVLDKELLKNHAKDPNQFHLPSVSGKEDKDGRIPFLKLGKRDENKEVNMEFTEFYENDRGKDFRNKYDVIYDKDRYYYVPKKFEDGGELPKKESELEETNQRNIIPEGALHAHKHHMENADNLTKKGIPVVDNDGEQQAEIEKNEIIFTLEVTKRLEELYSKYQDYEYSQKEKDEVAIEAGKLLVEEILFNTDDRTGLIKTLQKGGKINGIE